MSFKYPFRVISRDSICSESRKLLPAGLAAAALCIVPGILSSPAHAETQVTLNTSDASGSSSLNTAGNWSNGLAPQAGYQYTVSSGLLLRSPATTSADTIFEGDSLTIGTGARLLLKGEGTLASPSLITFSNANTAPSGVANAGELILDGGYMDASPNSAGDTNIAGYVSLATGSTSGIGASLFSGASPSAVIVSALVSGSGNLTISGQYEETTPAASNNETGGDIIIDGTQANTYSGSTTVTSGALELESAGANGTGAVIIDSGTTVDTLATGAMTASATTLDGNSTSGGGILANTFLTAGSAAANIESGGVLTVASVTGKPVIIDFGAGNTGATFSFANSSGATWSGPLDIYDWSGDYAPNEGGTDQLFFGTNASGLTQAQLDEITFYSGYGTGELGGGAPPILLADGQLSPAPEPAQIAMLALIGIGLGGLLLKARMKMSTFAA